MPMKRGRMTTAGPALPEYVTTGSDFLSGNRSSYVTYWLLYERCVYAHDDRPVF